MLKEYFIHGALYLQSILSRSSMLKEYFSWSSILKEHPFLELYA